MRLGCHRVRVEPAEAQTSYDDFSRRIERSEETVKGQQKPKKLAKKQPQKTLKERRVAKKAALKERRSSGF